MKITDKRGIQLNQAFGAVLAVVLVAVLVIIAIFLFDTLGTGFALQPQTTLNEAGGFINFSGYTLANQTACNAQNFAVTAAANATGANIVLANLTTNAATGLVTNATAETFAATTFNYTFDFGGDACEASADMVTQFATYPVLVGLVGTIIFLGLVIGVLVSSFLFGGRPRP